MLEDLTLREVFHFRVSLLGAITVITLSLVSLILLLSVLIVYTPIRNILPGYSESLRQQLIQESARVDSLQNSLIELAHQRESILAQKTNYSFEPSQNEKILYAISEFFYKFVPYFVGGMIRK